MTKNKNKKVNKNKTEKPEKKVKTNRNQDYKVLWVLLGILLVCFLVIGFLFYKYFYAGISTSKYGPRLDGIESYKLSSNLNEEISSIYAEEKSINKVSTDVEGRIIYINIDFKEPVKTATAQDLAIKSLEKIGEDNLTYYEVQFLLTYSGEEENANFPMFGSKNKNSLKVVW